jgi:CubicO group peptidase (beta-lactamase class C family)
MTYAATRRAGVALCFGLYALAAGGAWAAADDEGVDVRDRIARVRDGMLPAIVFKGEAGRPAGLAGRLRYHKVPGLSVAVIDGGRLEWARGFGVTEAGGATPVTPATLFQAGAVSRPVAAAAALALVDRGALDLDEDVNRRLTGWKVPGGEFTKAEKVTLRRLLSHTAGVTLDGFPGYGPGDAVPTLAQVLDGAKPARNAAVAVDQVPGGSVRPSAGGYAVVQQLLADAAGEPFERLARDAVFAKARMADSTFEQPLPPALAARAACGHGADGVPVRGRWRTYPEQAAAGLWTTPSDLARFAAAVRDAAGRPGGFLGPEVARLMLTPHAKNAGLGLFVDGAGGDAERFNHAGRTDGFDTVMVMYTRDGKGAVVMLNANNNAGLAAEVLQSIAREYGWPDYRPTRQREVVRVAAAVLRSYEGKYRAGRDATIDVRADGERLFAKLPGLGPVELFGEAEDRFFTSPGGMAVTFVWAGGRAAAIKVGAGGREETAPREP